jgi:hypothetical protein
MIDKPIKQLTLFSKSTFLISGTTVILHRRICRSSVSVLALPTETPLCRANRQKIFEKDFLIDDRFHQVFLQLKYDVLWTAFWKHIGMWRYTSRILNFGTWWRWVVKFMSWPPYPSGKHPQYPLNRRLGGSQSRTGRCRKQKSVPVAFFMEWPNTITKNPSPYTCT